MGIKRYYAIADATITNAFKEDMTTRATGANIGAADTLEVYSIYNQTQITGGHSSGSAELSRALLHFNVTGTNSISADRTSGILPPSGKINFYLRMFDVAHDQPISKHATYDIVAASSGWEEGRGADLDQYGDLTKDDIGVNWVYSTKGNAWTKPGGTYHTASTAGDNSTVVFTTTLEEGMEDLEVDITALVEEWVAGTKENYGLGLFLTSTMEAFFSSSTSGPDNRPFLQDFTGPQGGVLHNTGGSVHSYYTKKFSARTSEYFFKRPVIEARWDSYEQDDRGNTYYSSSLATGEENINTLYLYNYFRGKLRDIPGIGHSSGIKSTGGSGKIFVSIFSGNVSNDAPNTETIRLVTDETHVTDDARNTIITGGWVSSGTYTASFALTSALAPVSTFYDVWFTGGLLADGAAGGSVHGVTQYFTGSFEPTTLKAMNFAADTEHVTNIVNLKPTYTRKETARMRTYTREKDWNPNIYTKATANPVTSIIESGSYKVFRVIDDLEAVSYGTGSDRHTFLSYDISGNYFDLDMSMLAAGYAYGLKFAFYNDSVGSWVEQPEVFKFRVED